MKNRVLRAGFTAIALAGTLVCGQAGARPAPAPARAEAPARKPNVIIILADDLGVDGIGAYGSEIATPNIDALARVGVTFDNAYSTPLCTPTRVRMMTGKESARNYTAFGYFNPAERTFAHAFAEAGYATGIVGKWQLSGNGYDGLTGAQPQQTGFAQSYLWQQSSQGKGSRYWGPNLTLNGKTQLSEWGFGPDFQNRWALNFIRGNKDRPFLLYYPIVLPHSPLVPTPDQPGADGTKPRFVAMVQYLDKLVGTVRAEVERHGLGKHTIILFAGDNGTSRAVTLTRNGQPTTGGKGLPTLSGTHVPMILSWAGRLPAGDRRDGLFDIMDVYPTLAAAAGLSVAPGLDGVDQLPVAQGKAAKARDWIFMHYAPVWIQDPARFAFEAKWKLYGDGQLVALDPEHNVEQPVPADAMRPEARKAKARLERVLATCGDGPLDQNRFPMCAGRPSKDTAVSSTIAGCDIDLSGGNE